MGEGEREKTRGRKLDVGGGGGGGERRGTGNRNFGILSLLDKSDRGSALATVTWQCKQHTHRHTVSIKNAIINEG